jgi:hypothetical protein
MIPEMFKYIKLAFYILCLFPCLSSIQGQPTFAKTPFPMDPGRISAIREVSDGYVLSILASYPPDYERVYRIGKITFEGDTLWSNNFSNGELMSIACEASNQGIHIQDSTSYYFSGAIAEPGEDVDILLLKTDNNGELIWQQSYGEEFYDVNANVVSLNDTVLLLYSDYGTGGFNQDQIGIEAVNLEGNVLWRQMMTENYSSVARQDIVVTDDGHIYLLYFDCDTDGACGSGAEKRLRMAHLDASGEPIWIKTLLEFGRLDRLTGNLLPLPDGRFLVSFYEGNGFVIQEPLLLWVDEEGNIDDMYIFPEDFDAWITDLILREDGTIVGVGNSDYHEPGSPIYYNTGWIFSMTQQGELLWERRIYESRPPYYRTTLTAGLETDDGGLFLVGSTIDTVFHHEVPWVVKLDSMGCFEPGCEEFEIITSTQSPPAWPSVKDAYELFPNPAVSGQSVYLRRAAQGEAATRMHLFNTIGERIVTIGLQGLVQERVALPQLPSGMYWVSLEHRKGRFGSMLPLIVAD